MGSDRPASAACAGAGGPPSAVCCMCGDKGLLSELFRCAACAARSQHTYCTERYPKVESYGTCNWCLRAGAGSAATASSSPVRSSAATVLKAVPSSEPGGRHARSAPAKVPARRDFTAEVSKPIKKQQQQRRLLLRRWAASDLRSGAARAGVRGEYGRPPPSPGVSRGRPRVRRYKLLEEVISS